MISGYAPVNGLQLYYELHGTDDGRPPLVLLHGGGSTIQTSFSELLPALARHRRVIAVEQQGHGHTADVDRPFAFDQSADDIAALLRHLHVDQADVLGYSNGGHIAIELALRHPKLVRRIVIESSMVSRDGCDPAFWEGFKGAKLESMPPELKKAYVETSPHPDRLQSFFDKSVERMLHFKGWTPEQLKSIQAPVLVLAGDRDIGTPEHSVRMFRMFPNADLAILPGTDHMRIVQRSDGVASLTESFLAK
ncbi:MAG TPA: alpha/beta hydrolase [Planctomycetota bacterium]|nr:alpha/beta hydrolase [Planctomycetota bacterium]